MAIADIGKGAPCKPAIGVFRAADVNAQGELDVSIRIMSVGFVTLLVGGAGRLYGVTGALIALPRHRN